MLPGGMKDHFIDAMKQGKLLENIAWRISSCCLIAHQDFFQKFNQSPLHKSQEALLWKNFCIVSK